MAGGAAHLEGGHDGEDEGTHEVHAGLLLQREAGDELCADVQEQRCFMGVMEGKRAVHACPIQVRPDLVEPASLCSVVLLEGPPELLGLLLLSLRHAGCILKTNIALDVEMMWYQQLIVFHQ